MKKSISFILSVIIMIGIFFIGCKDTSQKEKIIINIKVPIIAMNEVVDLKTRDAYSFLKKAAKEFSDQYKEGDITINIFQFELTKEEEITDCFDTEKAADILYDKYLNMSTYIYSGRVLPLDDIITDEIRNDINEIYWKGSQLNGKTYMIPFLSIQNVLCYNKDLFRQAGLNKFISEKDIIQNWTFDEWTIILKTLREKLPDTSYPMMMYAASNEGDTHIMTLLRSFGSEFFDKDGYFNINNPQGIEALKWIRECNEKKYFPPNAETLVMRDNYEMFENGQLAIYMNNATLTPYFKKAGLDIGYVNFPSINGNGYCNSFITGFEVFDNGDEAKIKVAKDFIRFIYESDWLDYCAESIPASKKTYKKYEDKLKGISKYIENAKNSINFTGNNPNWIGVRAVFHKHIQDLLYGEKPLEEIARDLDLECNKAIDKGHENTSVHN